MGCSIGNIVVLLCSIIQNCRLTAVSFVKVIDMCLCHTNSQLIHVVASNDSCTITRSINLRREGTRRCTAFIYLLYEEVCQMRIFVSKISVILEIDLYSLNLTISQSRGNEQLVNVVYGSPLVVLSVSGTCCCVVTESPVLSGVNLTVDLCECFVKSLHFGISVRHPFVIV